MSWEGIGVVIALVLGVANLGLNWWVTRNERKTRERLAAIEDARRHEELSERKRAAVTARFLPPAEGRGLRLTNAGPATAQHVDFVMLEPVGDGDIPRVSSVPSSLNLQPGQDFTLVTAISYGCAPAVRARLTWKDDTGEQERDVVLEIL